MKYELAKHVSLTQVDDEAVLLDLDSGAYYGLNHVGADFLQQIQQDKSFEQALHYIVSRYQMPKPTVANDIELLLQQLIQQKLLIEQVK